jgi:hypothetical protein
MKELIDLITASDNVIDFCGNLNGDDGSPLFYGNEAIFRPKSKYFLIEFKLTIHGATVSIDYVGQNKSEFNAILDCLQHNFKTKKPSSLLDV